MKASHERYENHASEKIYHYGRGPRILRRDGMKMACVRHPSRAEIGPLISPTPHDSAKSSGVTANLYENHTSENDENSFLEPDTGLVNIKLEKGTARKPLKEKDLSLSRNPSS